MLYIFRFLNKGTTKTKPKIVQNPSSWKLNIIFVLKKSKKARTYFNMADFLFCTFEMTFMDIFIGHDY